MHEINSRSIDNFSCKPMFVLTMFLGLLFFLTQITFVRRNFLGHFYALENSGGMELFGVKICHACKQGRNLANGQNLPPHVTVVG